MSNNQVTAFNQNVKTIKSQLSPLLCFDYNYIAQKEDNASKRGKRFSNQ